MTYQNSTSTAARILQCEIDVAMGASPSNEVLNALAGATAATVEAVTVESTATRARAWAAWNHAVEVFEALKPQLTPNAFHAHADALMRMSFKLDLLDEAVH
ncbi:hypothetical protein [Actimicrobium antarcticum]|uniref:Uncharacterized protein n=1 Tax=Actimicrobium antarcticum TaxID=1051899 RepID=A0ABP7SUP7_9BURK